MAALQDVQNELQYLERVFAIDEICVIGQHTSRNAQETSAAVGQLAQAIDGVARGASDQAVQVLPEERRARAASTRTASSAMDRANDTKRSLS